MHEMNSNKFYCRNATQSMASNSSMSSGTASALGCANSSLQDYIGCNSVHASSDFVCKEQLSRNGNTKAIFNHHGTNGTASYTGGNNTSGYCSSSSSGAGNYINVMPVPMGSLQYHRRKMSTQEYQQPRVYYNTTDYKSRDDYYTIGNIGVGCSSGNGRFHTSSPSPSLQNQQQNNTVISHQSQHKPQQHHNQHHQTQQHQQFQNQQQQYQQHQQLHQFHNQHQSICSTDTANESIEESPQLSAVGSNCRTLQSGSSHHSVSNVVGEQVIVPTTVSSIGNMNVSGPPLMYTVHRVVTTAQIQTATGNTYASSSSISSVVSAVRNETDCTAAPVLSKNLHGCSVTGSALPGIASVNILADTTNSYINQNPINGNNGGPATVTTLRSSPGMSTNYLPQQKCNSSCEDQQSGSVRVSNKNYNSLASGSNTSYITGSKSSSSISRPLQNVIPTCVFLMSRVAVHMEIDGTVQCPAQVMLAAALGCEELGIANKLLAQSIFGLWMTSALLDIQLKSHHRPYVVRLAWKNLLEKFSRCNPIEIKFDEPMIILKRNVFFSKKDEEKIKDHRILELLYEEAKHNVISGRYVMESVHALMLGGIQARIELGPFNSNTHTISFFRENQSRFLPSHVAKSSSWSWLPVSRKNSAEVKLLEQFKRVPQTATTRKLMRKYLEFCWALPFYGSAYFHGQVEEPVRGVMSLVNHKDVEVLIAVNERGVFIIDPNESTLLLGLKYEDLLWDFAKPSANDDPECLTCIFLQFDTFENGIQISKLMQIFSKQAPMIDALISHFAEQMRKRKGDGNSTEQYHDEPNPIQNSGNGVLCNKLSRLTLATFDEEGRCIGQMGSLSISY